MCSRLSVDETKEILRVHKETLKVINSVLKSAMSVPGISNSWRQRICTRHWPFLNYYCFYFQMFVMGVCDGSVPSWRRSHDRAGNRIQNKTTIHRAMMPFDGDVVSTGNSKWLLNVQGISFGNILFIFNNVVHSWAPFSFADGGVPPFCKTGVAVHASGFSEDTERVGTGRLRDGICPEPGYLPPGIRDYSDQRHLAASQANVHLRIFIDASTILGPVPSSTLFRQFVFN